MACNLSQGFELGCKQDSGGLKEVFLVELSEVIAADITYDATTDEIEALPTMTVYRYVLDKNLSSYTDTLTYEEGGSVHFVQALSLVIKNLTPAKRKEIMEKVGRNRVVAFVRRNESVNTGSKQLIALGLQNGLDITSGESGSGTTLGDMSGYTLTFSGDEPESAPFLDAYTSNPFDNFGTVTVDPAYAT
jgi:hypothetical protein